MQVRTVPRDVVRSTADEGNNELVLDYRQLRLEAIRRGIEQGPLEAIDDLPFDETGLLRKVNELRAYLKHHPSPQ